MVATKLDQEIRRCSYRLEDVEATQRPGGPIRIVSLGADHDGWTIPSLYEARRDNPDHTSVPLLPCSNNESIIWLRLLLQRRLQNLLSELLTASIDLVQLFGQPPSSARIGGKKQLDGMSSTVEPSCRVDTRR
jgi:hypothetical protein